MIIPCVFGPLIHSSLEYRNFKTDASGWDPRNLFWDYSLAEQSKLSGDEANSMQTPDGSRRYASYLRNASSLQSLRGGSGELSHFGRRGFGVHCETVVDKSFAAGGANGDHQRST